MVGVYVFFLGIRFLFHRQKAPVSTCQNCDPGSVRPGYTGARDRQDTGAQARSGPLRLALAATVCTPRSTAARPSRPHRITDRRPPPLRTGRAAVLPLRGVAGSDADERGSEAGRGREWS